MTHKKYVPTLKDVDEAIREINACLEDKYDGHDYLWDAMQTRVGGTVMAALLLLKEAMDGAPKKKT